MPTHAIPRRFVSFWPLQIGGWTLYTLATAITFGPYSHTGAEVLGIVAELGSCFFASFLLYFLCRYLWSKGVPLFRALSACATVSYALGVVCTIASRLTQMHWADQTLTFDWRFALTEAMSVCLTLEGWCALYFGIKHYQTVEQQKEKLLAIEATARDAQLLALHYQLQPHFFFNTLNAISSLVVSNQPLLATEMISRLAALLRNTLSFPDTHTVTLRDELAVVDEYLTIERIRFGSRLSVSIDVIDEANDAHVPRFLLQPLIENAIRHAIALSPAGGEITISARLAGHRLQIDIANDTFEMESTDAHQSHGVGLANTRARLKQIYGANNATLVLSGGAGRFVVSLQLPLITEPVVNSAVVG
ncbi:sensor histidine kinase [Dyella flagellata]|uniref:Histidine kinase n=1 Tax=Dyella flagellata TaxID=1867833 RepID=A0ABQ5XER6_9GAMM|nr:histidine kinase [Dyella flagellata]GLQ89083.1 histidine kinase [Dyella flagellata]